MNENTDLVLLVSAPEGDLLKHTDHTCSDEWWKSPLGVHGVKCCGENPSPGVLSDSVKKEE